jgi:hypothetical protein
LLPSVESAVVNRHPLIVATLPGDTVTEPSQLVGTLSFNPNRSRIPMSSAFAAAPISDNPSKRAIFFIVFFGY